MSPAGVRILTSSSNRPYTSECKHPKFYPGEPPDWLAKAGWAEKMQRTHEQKFCAHCRRWVIWEKKT